MNRRRVSARRSATDFSLIGAMISYPAMRMLAHSRKEPRNAVALVPALALALSITVPFAAASALARTPARLAGAQPTVKIADTLVGPLVVNKSGRTVYMFVRDKPGKDLCHTISGCEKDWPPVTTVGTPVAGPGVKKSLLGTIPYKGSLREVTYKGHPLHTYRFDTSNGSVLNIGLVQYGGAWYALNPKGGLIK